MNSLETWYILIFFHFFLFSNPYEGSMYWQGGQDGTSMRWNTVYCLIILPDHPLDHRGLKGTERNSFNWPWLNSIVTILLILYTTTSDCARGSQKYHKKKFSSPPYMLTCRGIEPWVLHNKKFSTKGGD